MTDTAVPFDPLYEYDAPMYHDFKAEPANSTHSDWFVQHGEDGYLLDDAHNSTRNILTDIANEPKKTNIVSSWGHEVKKRKAVTGPASHGSAKATKPSKKAKPADEGTAGVQPSASKKGSEHEAPPKAKTAKQYKPVAIIKKSKSDKNRAAKLARVLGPLRAMPTRSTKKLTVPEELNLCTTKRAGAHQRKAGGASGKQVKEDDDDDDVSEDDGGDNPYKPLVLRVKEFDKTPGRFKKQPDAPAPSKPLTITQPMEPQLRVLQRTRPSTFKPREVEEAEEMASMPVFKASTLNPLILTHSGKLGVPVVEKRGLTEQLPFHFITDDRSEARAARLQQQGGEAGPSKQPVQQAAAGRGDDQERGLPAKARKSVAYHVTDPRSPMLHTKFRKRETKVEEPLYEFHARPVPKYLSVPSLELPALHVEGAPAPTKPEPFKLATEERGAQHRQALTARLAAEEKAERLARIPRAQQLPVSTDMPLVPPKPEPRKLTVPEPFQLVSEMRHHDYEEQRRKALEAEEEKREAAAFKARPMWQGVPFRLHETDLPLTYPESVPLHTSARATERGTFDKAMQEKIREAELAKQQTEEEQRLREEEERRQLRKAANFRARPMPDLSAAPVAKPPPPKPLTKAVSPRLGRKKRRVTTFD